MRTKCLRLHEFKVSTTYPLQRRGGRGPKYLKILRSSLMDSPPRQILTPLAAEDPFEVSIASMLPLLPFPCFTSPPPPPLEQLPLLVGESDDSSVEEAAILLFLVTGSSTAADEDEADAAAGAVEATTPDSTLDIYGQREEEHGWFVFC